ncbi:MAG: segregation and condensation protein A [Alphaproteobacteria bacterium]
MSDSEIADDERLLVDVGGYEGPLDMLLALARDQKVDLAKISILALADQYLVFIADARRIRLELAADYLVMAAWLAYLKSRLLLPDTDDGEEPSGDELAAALAFRLRRLEAMREAATRIMNRNRLGRDIFPRGQTEPVVISRTAQFQAGLYDMLEAYSAMRSRSFVRHVRFERRKTMTLKEARDRLLQLVGPIAGSQYNWSSIDAFIAEFVSDPEMRATALASSLTASLELVREGTLDVRQSSPFAPIFVRRREQTSADTSSDRKDMPADA